MKYIFENYCYISSPVCVLKGFQHWLFLCDSLKISCVSFSPVFFSSELNTFRGESLTAMSLSADRRKLNLGAKNKFYIVDLSQPFGELAAVTVRTWNSSRSDTNSCLMKGKQNWQCQNFIQVVLKNDGENRLMVCGTNAWAPQCRYYQVNISGCLDLNVHQCRCGS